jgi:glycosyltransferase involved in cell wall biosynthesis
MTPRTVSVVIPTYNRAHCITRAIDSAVGQTYPGVDIVVVDDGSTDGTEALIAKRYGHDPRVRYLRQENQGVSAARNTGLRAARGDYIALLDSDDIWKPWKLELQVACLERAPQAGMIWTDMEAIDADGKVFDPRYLRTMYSAYQWFSANDLFEQALPLPAISAPLPADARLYAGDIYSPMIMGNLVHTSTVLLRRERLERVGGFNVELRYAGEDYEFHLRTCREGPVAFIDLASIQYQKGWPDQLTGDRYAIYRARNFLKTITPALARDRDRIRLPRSMIRFLLADACAYVGQAALDIGSISEARRHLLLSLLRQPWQPRIAGLFALSLLPAPVGRAAREALRTLRRLAGRADVSSPSPRSGS